MDHHEFLITAIAFLSAAVIAVPVFKRFGLASVLGYLAAGSVIGPAGFEFVRDVESTLAFAEIGVVLLLFIIGLELKPSRLWVLRKSVFGLGGLQVLLTALPLTLLALAFSLPLTLAIIVGLSLAFSSTAFALQLLGERKELSTKQGRAAFSILLFQDLAAIPLIAAIPLLGRSSDGLVSSSGGASSPWISALIAAGTIGLLILGGRLLLRPAFRLVAATRTSEIFTAAALLLVLGVSFLMESIGLSMALGAFIAGILLADSEYRHELEADIEPFKGLLLGLFFMAVGMTVDYQLILQSPGLVLSLVCGLLLIKMAVNYALGKWSGLSNTGARGLAALLPQGGEFAFVVFSSAIAHGVMPKQNADLLVVVVTLSMAITPLLVLFNDRVLNPWLAPKKKEFDSIADEENSVIIAGFGRVGQINGRLMKLMDYEVTALDSDADQIEVFRKFGSKVYYGDASKLDLLKAAGADKAKIFILAIDDVAASLRTATVVRTHFPHLEIFARARNRRHVFELMDLGITRIWRETLSSSLEMSEAALISLGKPASEVKMVIEKFREHDEVVLREQHTVYRDEGRLIDVSKQAVLQLAEVLKSDREDRTRITN